jgi:plasmid stabilization system protein ParE
MMRPVIVMDRARQELEDGCRWWAKNRSHEQAERWYDGFSTAIKGLATSAEQYAVAEESKEFPIEIRQLNYGLSGRPTHRALFTIRPDMILVLRVQHLAQGPLTSDDI